MRKHQCFSCPSLLTENCHLDRLDIDDLSMIAQSPAFNVWEAVCSFLGVSNAAIITAKESHLGNARREREAAFLECLKTWYIGKTDTHVCWEILLAAIAEAGEPAYVQQLWTDIDSRGVWQMCVVCASLASIGYRFAHTFVL